MKQYRLPLLLSAALVVLAIGVVTVLRMPHAKGVTGSDWAAGRIIDDAIFFNADTLNPGDIQNFLNAKVPTCDTNGTQASTHSGYPTRADWGRANGAPPPYTCVRNYTQAIPSVAADSACNGIGGGTKSAADIIFNVAQACNVNPKALIVLLQKEQSLITDDWPWPIQYRSATGYGCPDTAPCDAEYYGFFNQVYNAAHQFRRYVQRPDVFNYAVGRNSFVAYNPNGGCNGSNVTIVTQASAALYNYTPYQPNQAALNNLYGIGDACSAYGNRNFWRMYNDWFGSTRSDSFTVAVTEGGSSQYLLFGGIKQAIPDPETKVAWGLQNYPVVSMPGSYLATIPSGPYLDRLTRLNTSDNTVFFMDNGKRYRVTSPSMFDSWNFGGKPITNVPPGLFYVPADGGELKYSVKNIDAATVYAVDGAIGGQTVLRPYQSDTVRMAWEGEGTGYTEVSSAYFSTIDNAVGATLTSTKITYGGNEYQVLNGSRLYQPSPYSSLYPGTAQAVSGATFNRLPFAGGVSQFIRIAGAPTVYLVDGGTKHAVANPTILNAWTPRGAGVWLVNTSFASLIAGGAALNAFAADAGGGQFYVMNSQKRPVLSAIAGSYQTLPAANVSMSLLSLYQTGDPLTGFVRGEGTPEVFLLDSSGNKRHIDSGMKANLYGAYTTGVTVLPSPLVSIFPLASNPQTFVSDGTTEYVLEGGVKHPVSGSVKTDWGLSGAQVFSDGTLGRFGTGAAMTTKVRDGNSYFLVKEGRAFMTADINIANTWGISDAPEMTRLAIDIRMACYMLTRFVRPTTPGDNRVFVVNQGQWYNLPSAQFANLGGIGAPVMGLNPSNAPNTITDWTNIVVKDGAGRHYVIDGGTKRAFANSTIQNWWTNNGSLTVPTMTNGFLNLLPNNDNIERAIKGSGPAVYSAQTATKRHILYSNLYHQYYAPFALVSDALINAMPTGSDIAS